MSDRAVIAVVDDEPEVVDLFTAWLEETYEVRTAYSGTEGLEIIDDEVDVALVDRLMSDTSGDEMVVALEERGWDGQIAMVTAVEPDIDIVEMAFDDYLVKPVFCDTLEATVERLLERANYEERLRELFALSTKRATVESQKTEAELADSEQYRRLVREIHELRKQVDETAAEFDDREFEAALREISGEH